MTPLSPDCAATPPKHTACVGQAWDEDRDCLTRCECDCHRNHQEHP